MAPAAGVSEDSDRLRRLLDAGVARLDAARARGDRPQTCAMDKGYDSERVHAECEQRGAHPAIPLRASTAKHPLPIAEPGTRRNPRIPLHTDEWRTLYRGRSAVEREFGRLKNEYGLAPLRTQGPDRVRIHADLAILARLGQALARARAVPLAA